MRKFKNWFTIINAVRLITALTFMISVIRGLWALLNGLADPFTYFVTALTALGMLALSYIPSFLNQKDILAMPMMIQTLFAVFTFLAMYLGDIFRFYDRFPWWDVMLHLLSGAMFTIIGYLIFCSLNRDSAIRNFLNPVSVVLFALCFSLACELIWELFEFSADSLLITNMQRWRSSYTVEEWLSLKDSTNWSNPGLIDTMKDVVCNTVGATAASVYVYFSTVRGNRYVRAEITTHDIVSEWNTKSVIWNRRKKGE